MSSDWAYPHPGATAPHFPRLRGDGLCRILPHGLDESFLGVIDQIVIFTFFRHIAGISRFPHRLLNEAKEAFLTVLHEGFELVAS